MSKERAETYWICHECAKVRGWKPPKGSVTVIVGLCGHCISDEPSFLVPAIDFIKPLDNLYSQEGFWLD